MKFSGNPYNPYRILIKSEGGKGKATTIFSMIMDYCITRKEIEKTILMLDLDGITLKKQLYNLEQTINTRRAGESISIESNTIKEKNSIFLLENKLKTKENKIQIGRPFYLVLFVYSLEHEAEIHASDDVNSIEDKIFRLVEKRDIQDMFSLVFG